MRAVIARDYGAPESFALETVADPVPGAGEVCVRVQVAAVNFVDVLVAGGTYQMRPPLPFTPGGEFAGVVESVGPGVEILKPGDRVCGSSVGGAYGEKVALKETLAFKVPDSMSFTDAATFRVSNATAYHALVQRGALKAGERVLVMGAGGAVGYAAIQIAKALGARVVGSASSEGKRATALAAGADAVVDSRAEDWRDQVKAAAGGPLDIVVDPIGGDMTEKAFRNLGWGGRHLVIGFAGGGIPRLPTNLALVKGAALVGVDVRQFSLYEPEVSAANMQALFSLYEAGRLPIPPVRLFPFERFAEAMNEVKGGQGAGRALLTVAG